MGGEDTDPLLRVKEPLLLLPLLPLLPMLLALPPRAPPAGTSTPLAQPRPASRAPVSGGVSGRSHVDDSTDSPPRSGSTPTAAYSTARPSSRVDTVSISPVAVSIAHRDRRGKKAVPAERDDTRSTSTSVTSQPITTDPSTAAGT